MVKTSIQQEHKYCKSCSKVFFKNPKDSYKQWGEREYCSMSCNNRSRDFIALHLRFWKYVLKDESGCWFWTGSKDGHGYGKISVGHGVTPIKAHRLSFEMRYGAIDDGNVICHKCDNPSCVNPEHLFQGTQKDNMQDASKKNRLNPKSLLNLRPGEKGCRGAGSKSVGEIANGL